ncbi:unnamed protein product [Nezara viridula]|uniref:Uncharacterized protein n=1 Tax=Nezara viridula TaxID=85310 RepID=A0A9P0H0A2_NEZVI|nr:unnamed protein product [Nezara viridula]
MSEREVAESPHESTHESSMEISSPEGELLKRLDRVENKLQRLVEDEEKNRLEKVVTRRIDNMGEQVMNMVREEFKRMSEGISLGEEVVRMERVCENVGEKVEKVGEEVVKVERVCENVSEKVEKVVSAVNVVENVAKTVTDSAKTDGNTQEGEWLKVVKYGKKGPRVRLEMPGGDSKLSKEEVVACLDAKQGDVRVRGLIKRGNDYVIEVHDRTDLEKLRQNERLKEKGVIVDGEKGWRMPRVKVFDVQNEIGKNDLLECVYRRNVILFDGMTMDECKSEFVPEYMMNKKDAVSDWVVRVSASETTAKGTGLEESAGKEDPVELDSSLVL